MFDPEIGHICVSEVLVPAALVLMYHSAETSKESLELSAIEVLVVAICFFSALSSIMFTAEVVCLSENFPKIFDETSHSDKTFIS